MKFLNLIFLFLFCTISAQKILSFDSLKIREAQDFFADDYGNIYLYKNKDFSFTKYDSLGKQVGKMMLTLPFKVQSVQNPLNIVLFSENAQELKFIDQNLNEIQKFEFRQKFGFIKLAYAEDLQLIWLLDESEKRLLQYNFRDDKIINSYPFHIDLEKVLDLIVYENKVYLLTENQFLVYNLKGELVFGKPIQNPRKLRRKNDNIFIVTEKSIIKYLPNVGFAFLNNTTNSKIVDKNSTSYFEIKGNKLYLYEFKE